MLDITWKYFTETGNIDMYLLYKEMEKENHTPEQAELDLAEDNIPIS